MLKCCNGGCVKCLKSIPEPMTVGNLDRLTYLGGSDAANILGIGYKTPVELYFEKINPLSHEERERNSNKKIFKRGKRLEPIVIDILAEDYPIKITKRSTDESPNRYVDWRYDFMAAEIDFEFEVTKEFNDSIGGIIPDELIGTIQNGEVKTVSPMAAHKWGESGTDEVPIEYAAQSMYGLMITERRLCLYAVLIGMEENGILIYIVYRDDETIAAMREKSVKFWLENVIKRVPPEPVDLSDMMRLFSKTKGRPVNIDENIASLLAQREALKQKSNAFDEQAKELEFQICMSIRNQWGLSPDDDVADNASIIYDGKEIATWKAQSRAGIDSAALREDYPDIAKKYTKQSHFRVLRLKKSKGN